MEKTAIKRLWKAIYCPKCNGTGIIRGWKCLSCNGTGYTINPDIIEAARIEWQRDAFEAGIEFSDEQNIEENWLDTPTGRKCELIHKKPNFQDFIENYNNNGKDSTRKIKRISR